MKHKNLIRRKGIWYVTAMVSGKRIFKSTGTGTLRDATKIRDDILAPFKLSTKKETLQALESRIQDLEETITQQNIDLATLAQAWQQFVDASIRPKCSQGNLKTYEGQYNKLCKWLKTENYNIELISDITPSMARAFIHDMEQQNFTSRTIVKYLNCFSLIWRVLIQDDAIVNGHSGIKENLWDTNHIARPSVDRVTGRKKDLNPAEIDRLLAHADKADIHDILTILAYTGMRVGDAAHLAWDNISDHAISIYPRKTASRHAQRVNIPILPAVEAVLNKRMHFPDEPLIFPELAISYDRDNGSAITKQIGKVFDKAGFQRHVNNTEKGVVRRAQYGAHSLRHSSYEKVLSIRSA